MVPRLRHVDVESLKKELQHIDLSRDSSSPSLSVKDSWRDAGVLNENSICDHDYSHSRSTTVGIKIPGSRTSIAFFSSLRTNLHLGVSLPPSPMSTPPSMRASASSIDAPPSPLQQPMSNSLSNVPDNPLANIPELKTYITEAEDEKKAALKLVADGVAQMRQTANRILMFHPVNLAAFTVFLAVVGNYLYKSPSDIGLVFTTSVGLAMAAMVTVRWITGPYIAAAEQINLSLLDDADVLVTKFGDEIIGTVILGWVDGEKKGKKRKSRGSIRGWAVRLRYRGKHEGLTLLETAVDVAKKAGADGVVFASDHANSKRVLWDFYNGPFEKRERKAREKLQTLWDASSKPKRR